MADRRELLEQAQVAQRKLQIRSGVAARNEARQAANNQTGESYLRGLGRSFEQGALANFGDEATAALAAGAARLTGAAPSYSQAYNDIVGSERYLQGRFAQENPASNVAAQLAGGLGSAVVGGGVLPTLPGNALVRTAGAGGAVGGLYGAGAGEGTKDTIGQALGGAVTGAVLAPVTGAALVGLKALFGPSATSVLNAAGSDRARASKLIQRALTESGYSAAEAKAELQRLGPDAVLADLGGQLRNLARGAQSLPTGSARAQAEQFLSARAAGQQSRLWQKVQELTGSTGNAKATLDELSASQAVAARPAYAEAYKATIEPTPELTDAFKLSGIKAAFKKGVTLAENETGQKIKVDLNKVPTDTRSWDHIQRGLRAMAASNLRNGNGELARSQFILRDNILNQLDSQNPAFAEARRTFASHAAVKDAVEAGQGALRMDAEDLSAYLANLTTSEKQGFVIGVTKAIRNAIEGPGANRDISKAQLFQSPAIRERLSMALGNDTAGKLLDAAAAEAQKAETARTLLNRSPTADVIAAQREILGGYQNVPESGQGLFRRIAQGALAELGKLSPEAGAQLTRQLLMPNPNLAPVLPPVPQRVNPLLTPWLVGQASQPLSPLFNASNMFSPQAQQARGTR